MKPQSIQSIGITAALFWVATVVYFGCQPESKKEHSKVGGESVIQLRAQFTGEQSCAPCHQQEYQEWETSHHAFSMQPANKQNVKADFNNARFKKDGITFTFFTRNNKYWVNTKAPDGAYRDFEILYTFGTSPLQQYLAALPGGRMQALETAWDEEKNKWFHLYEHLKLTHNEWLNWTGGAMNWNTMCAQCHSTYLEKDFDESQNTFNTKWTSVNVSCEACHGPGTKHIEYIRSDAYTSAEKVTGSYMQLAAGIPAKVQVDACAPCHSRRGQLTKNWPHSGQFMDHFLPSTLTDGLYHADGQIQDEVYVYGSFTQSKMYRSNVRCTNCHDPHTARVKFPDNRLCMPCHEPEYDRFEHHFHDEGSEGAQCINCHMPGKHYMGNDFRRDHSFRVPRPDLSAAHGTPNACNQCHDDKSSQWAARQVEKWHGKDRTYHYSEDLILGRRRAPQYLAALKKMLTDTAQPVIVRATAIQYIDDTAHPEANNDIIPSLKSPEALIRSQALRALADLPTPDKIHQLAPLLRDKTRAVRITAADVLLDVPRDRISGVYQKDFKRAHRELVEYLDANVDGRDGMFSYAQYYDRQNMPAQAEKYYLKALRADSLFNMSRLNLGVLYNKQGRNDEALKLYKEVINIQPDYAPAYYSLGLLYAELKQLDKTVEYLSKAVELSPEHIRARYNLGLALQNINKSDEAERVYLQALELAPQYWELHHAIAILYYQQRKFKQAKQHIDLLVRQFPDSDDLRAFQAQVDRVLNK